MANQPISVETANQMIASYITYMKNLGVDMERQTESVSFSSPGLINWLNEVAPYCDEIRIFNGLYGSGDHDQRTTVILWPYRNGQPATRQQSINGDNYVNPLNEGELHP